MPGRIPTKNDLPKGIFCDIIPPKIGGPVNVLILLHGLGDAQTSFTSLASNLSLPETCGISVRAPAPLPFDLGGFHWGNDIVFDNRTGGLDPAGGGLDKATTLVLDRLIKEVLIEKCGFSWREIIFLGFGQGANVAISVAAAVPELELGGVVAIGGSLAEGSTERITEIQNEQGQKSKTPVLICKATRGSQVVAADISRTKGAFNHVEVVEWSKPGDGMPSNRDEMLPIMKFFARRLRSIAGVPNGATEMT